jgi:hypothetical protein
MMRGLPATALTRVVRAEGGRRSASHSAGHPARYGRLRARKGDERPLAQKRRAAARLRVSTLARPDWAKIYELDQKKELPKISYFDIVTSMVGT